MSRPSSRTRVRVRVVDDERATDRKDHVATEEPLEIRIAAGAQTSVVATTMRTPGADFELACGFLLAEGIVASERDVARIAYCTDASTDQLYNIVTVELARRDLPDTASLQRRGFVNSSCGVCGKATIEALDASGCAPVSAGPALGREVLRKLPDSLRASQGIFDSTGGLHAAGLFSPEGDLLCAREDVGRHNAVDKVLGRALLDGMLPLDNSILLVSGRVSYEIVQKALVAGVPVVCAISAPSSLAVDVAKRFGMTLIGFLRDERFNVYADAERLVPCLVPEAGNDERNASIARPQRASLT